MRLTPEEVGLIKSAARDAFGEDAVVRLFGSRVDDAKRGGDIDLHVEVADAESGHAGEVPFRRMLWRALDRSEIDVVVAARGAAHRWIDDAAHRSGIIL